MNATYYIIVLFIFILTLCFFVCKGLISSIQERIVINQLKTYAKHNVVNNEILLLGSLIYFSKDINDLSIYYTKFSIKKLCLNDIKLSDLYTFLGLNYESVNNLPCAVRHYNDALKIYANNLKANQRLGQLIESSKFKA